jgi:hypothetical protein
MIGISSYGYQVSANTSKIGSTTLGQNVVLETRQKLSG